MTILRIKSGREGSKNKTGFSLVEVLVATTILVIVVLVLMQMTLGMTALWQSTSGSISSFQSARLAFASINRDLSRATLQTYYDYVDTGVNGGICPSTQTKYGVMRTYNGTTTYNQLSNNAVLNSAGNPYFVPTNAAIVGIPTATSISVRASELHFVSGPSTYLLGESANANLYPGDAIFFQAPLGYTLTSSDKYLSRSLNSLGFFVQYSTPPNLPSWMSSIFGAKYKFRLIKAIQPTENFDLYTMTSTGTYNSLAWLPSTGSVVRDTTYTTSVLADNVLLLIFRPRLDSTDEATFQTLSGATTSVCKDYNYDSRAWEYNYVGPTGNNYRLSGASYARFWRNQLPTIVDVAMIVADDASMARLPIVTAGTPPVRVQVPTTLFTTTSSLDADLASYESQLSAKAGTTVNGITVTGPPIRYKVFRSSVYMQSSAWVNN